MNQTINNLQTPGNRVRAWLFLSFVALTLIGSSAAVGGTVTAGSPFLRTEYSVLGSGISGSWRSVDLNTVLAYGQIGGQGIEKKSEVGSASGPEKVEGQDDGPSHLGDKIKSGVLSAVLPGAGQLYNGDHKKAYILGGVEVAIWTAYFVFDKQGDNRFDSSVEYAGIYAGTSGTHAESYWQNVGRYMDSEAYNQALEREARALGETPSNLVSDNDSWQWVNEDRRSNFGLLRADSNRAYGRRDFMILFAVVNRAVAVVDAVLGAGPDDGTLETEVLGLNLGVEMLPSLRNPGAQCVISRRF